MFYKKAIIMRVRAYELRKPSAAPIIPTLFAHHFKKTFIIWNL